VADATLAKQISQAHSLRMSHLLAQGPSTIRLRENKLSKSPKLKISPKLSETPRSNLLNQPAICICPVQATQLVENHSLHHITSGAFMPPSPTHTWLKLCTLTQAKRKKSAQEFDQLLDVFIQKLEVRVMDSSYKDSQLHLVQGYQPCHHGLDNC